jgi:hypothetical protein
MKGRRNKRKKPARFKTSEAKMKALKAILQIGVILLSFGFLPERSSGQIYLTGLLQQGADSQTGHSLDSPIWNTLGNELSFANLYLTQPNAGYTAPFVNSGNGAGTSISYALTPGTYEFYFFCDALADNNPGYYGLNLFFDGNNTNPGIAAYSAAGVSSANAVLLGQNTLSLNGDGNNEVPAPGSLTYIADGLSVTLIEYGFGVSGAFGCPASDRVTNLNDSPDGKIDGVGLFTLSVTLVPEPSFGTIFVAAVSFFFVFKMKPARKPVAARLKLKILPGV